MGAFNRADIDSAAGGNGTLRLLDNRDTTRAIQTLKLTGEESCCALARDTGTSQKPG
jgi:hypothetical protein